MTPQPTERDRERGRQLYRRVSPHFEHPITSTGVEVLVAAFARWSAEAREEGIEEQREHEKQSMGYDRLMGEMGALKAQLAAAEEELRSTRKVLGCSVNESTESVAGCLIDCRDRLRTERDAWKARKR